MPINIYITSFFRLPMTIRTIDLIYDRTEPGTFKIHVFDNGSDEITRYELTRLLDKGRIESLHLDNRNTGCLYNKGIFYMMTESKEKYFCVTDNDIYPPKLEPDWLSRMIAIMEKYPKLGMLTPQLPPQSLQMPFKTLEDIVLCRAVGNTLKLVRTEAFPIDKYKQSLGSYGDDGIVSNMMIENGWEIAFCRDVFCFHAGQCEKWGYTDEQIALDPRKVGYGRPFTYGIVDHDTFVPEPSYRM